MENGGQKMAVFDSKQETCAYAPRSANTPRARYLLALDAGMLALVCVLEALSLTGLAWHEWLGFLLCVLVLLHVILQWPWFAAEFRRLFAPGAFRVRVYPVLNHLLFIVMVAVLVSGVLISSQIAPLTGNTLGRPRVWSELHGWLNFTLVVLVGAHLALNWHWVLGVMRRRTVRLMRLPAPANILWRGAIVLFASCLVAAAAYVAMAAMLKPTPREKRATVQMTSANQAPQPRKGRTQSFWRGMQELDVAVLVVVFLVILINYAPRIRL